MRQIQTNQVIGNLQIDKLVQTYQVFKVKTTASHFGKGSNAARIVDDMSNEKFVLAVVYEKGNSFYMLLRRADSNRMNISKAIGCLPNTENISFEEEAIASVPKQYLLQLLLNSLGTYEGKVMGFHNVTGHFYVHHPDWKKNKGKQLACLELRFTPDSILDWNIRTLTCIEERKFIKFAKKKFAEYPEYVLSKDNTLKRIEKGTNPEAFIIRQKGDKKTSIKFIDISNFDKFQASKMGVICECIDNFNKQFCGLAELRFNTFSDYQEAKVSTRMVKEMDCRFRQLVHEKDVVLVDKVEDETSEMAIGELKQQLSNIFGCGKISVLKRPKKDNINIMLVHEDCYYEKHGIEDPHDKEYKGCAVQHITIETVAKIIDSKDDSAWKPVLDCVMQESIIKDDITNNKVSLVNWQNYSFGSEIVFGIKNTGEDEISHYYFMTVRQDGSFYITEQENTIFEQSEFQDCMEIFRNSDVVGTVKRGEDINVIYNTRLRTLPEINFIRERLKSGDNKLRSEASREELFASVTDVKCFAQNDHSLNYFTGIIGAGMNRSIQNAANIRRVETYRFSKLFFDKILELMAVTFVRNGQLTVMPFPFKYLHEYVKDV